MDNSRAFPNGDIILPGRIVARAGLDRLTSSGATITLDAQASMFAESYRWEPLSSSAGSIVNIANPNAIGAGFSVDKDDDYEIRLTATSDSTDATEADTLSIMFDSELLIDPGSLTFCNDITTELDLFMNWIAEGAKCGIAGAAKCP